MKKIIKFNFYLSLMAAAKKISCFYFVVLLYLFPTFVLAQNEVERELHSLKGIQSLGFTVNVEKNASVPDQNELSLVSLQKLGEKKLRDEEITLIPDDEVRQSSEIPFLYMHINMMQTETGLIPFSLSLYFYQPVKLSLNNDLQTTASTWESGILGMVSYDRTDVIRQAVKNILDEFITDFNQIND